MSCNCDKAAPLPCCITNLTIGVTDSYAGSLLVAFKLPTGRIDYLPVNVGFTGAVVVESFEPRIGEIYEVTLVRDSDRVTPIPFAVGENEVSCLNLEFVQGNGVIESQNVILI